MIKIAKTFIFFTLFILFYSSTTVAQVTVTLESGVAINGYNDVRYFNGEQEPLGTLFSLTDDFSDHPVAPYGRVEVLWQFLDRNVIELTAAPLAFNYTNLEATVVFGDEVFSGPDVKGRYEFNTYRLSYRYLVANNDKWEIGLGASVLMRDARIGLTQGTKTQETTDLGFVPLISFDLRYKATDKLNLMMKGDALVGPQGRAEDVFFGINHTLWAPGLKYRVGYRIIEGGADVAQVYNFSLIHFAAVGLSYTF